MSISDTKSRKMQKKVEIQNQAVKYLDISAQIISTPSSSNIVFKNPLMISSFPGPGMIGSIIAEELIDQLSMHQIAYLHSAYLLPGVIWIGGRLRHPFRIYSTADGSITLVNCDVSVSTFAIHSTASAIINWCCDKEVSKIIVMSGIYPESISPFPSDYAKRKAFVVESAGNLTKKVHDNDIDANETPNFAFISGLSGQLLADSVVRSMHCQAILIPTLSTSPDPEGAALAVEILRKIIPNTSINSSRLREKAEMIKAQLIELSNLQHRLIEKEMGTRREEPEEIYK